MTTVFASGRTLNGDGSSDSGSKTNLMVSRPRRGRPWRVVEENVMLFSCRRGIRKSEVQPAPRIKTSTSFMVDSV